MENQKKELELVKLPVEVQELAAKVSESKQAEVNQVLNQIFVGVEDWKKQVDSIDVKGIEDKMSMQLAEVARKNAKQARLNGEKLFDNKREIVQEKKSEFDLEDKLWLKAKQIMQITFKDIEEKAEWKANFAKRFEAEQKELRTQKRINEVSKYSEINRFEFENMTDESFASLLSGLKSAYDAKIEQARKLEEERIAKEKEENEAREKQRLENIRLKEEAEAREKAEAEIRAKKEAEEKERKESELKAKKEAEKLAKAPIKKQLNTWVDSFSLPEIQLDNSATKLIKEKFEAFKKWAKTGINED